MYAISVLHRAVREGSFDALVLQSTLPSILRMPIENEISER